LILSKRVMGIVFLLIFVGGASLLWWQTVNQKGVPGSEKENEKVLLKIVRIGVTIANDGEWERYAPIIELAEEDIAAFCEEMESPFGFEFVVRNCESQAQVAFDLTKEFHENGTGLIVGHPWSGMMCHGVQEYIAENDMLLLSPSSTSPHWRIPDDNMFRLACHDPLQTSIIAEVLHSRDVKAIVIIERDDEWGNLVCDEIEAKFTALGGIVLRRIPYKPIVGGQERDDFSEFLVEAEALLNASIAEYGAGHLAVEFVGFSEAMTVIVQALGYPTLSTVPWYGSGMGNMLEKLGLPGRTAAMQLGLMGPTASPSYSRQYWELDERYENMTGLQLDFTGSNYYDGCWLYALSVIEANSTDVTLVKGALREIARDYIGVSGHCGLDENDDRLRGHYDVMGYFDIDGECRCLRCGFYNATTGAVTWDERLIQPLGGGSE
jgi:ABC-type branched-subunit amino acid transport system substrate-binding protein